jgi:hypothetical protein
MLPRVCVGLLFILCASGVSWAKEKGPSLTIKEIFPDSVTVTAGNEVEKTYKIVVATQFSLDGLICGVDDLRAGMAVGKIDIAPDGVTVISLAAKKAPRVTKKPPPQVIWY